MAQDFRKGEVETVHGWLRDLKYTLEQEYYLATLVDAVNKETNRLGTQAAPREPHLYISSVQDDEGLQGSERFIDYIVVAIYIYIVMIMASRGNLWEVPIAILLALLAYFFDYKWVAAFIAVILAITLYGYIAWQQLVVLALICLVKPIGRILKHLRVKYESTKATYIGKQNYALDCETYEKNRNAWEIQMQNENVMKSNLNAILPELRKRQSELASARKQMCANPYISRRYLSLIPVSAMCDYLDSGRCIEIYGSGGVIDTFEKDQAINSFAEELFSRLDRLEARVESLEGKMDLLSQQNAQLHGQLNSLCANCSTISNDVRQLSMGQAQANANMQAQLNSIDAWVGALAMRPYWV